MSSKKFLKVQIECQIFKPSGKLYDTYHIKLDAPLISDESIPALLYSYDTYDLIKEHFKGRFEGYFCCPKHELLTPHIIKL
jgi:hypothetical protein